MIYTTNAVDSLKARYRRVARARGQFPNEAGAGMLLPGHEIA
jgi:transposase-like protein